MDELTSRDGLFDLIWAGGGAILFIAGLLQCFWLQQGTAAAKLALFFLFLAIGLLALTLLVHADLSRRTLLCCLLPLGAAVLIRVVSLEYATGDYNDFLAPWTQFFRENGGFFAIREEVGNYNVPYLYFLAAFSYLRVPDLYLIKVLSIVFDVLLAYAGLRLARRAFPESESAPALAFSCLLLLPTVLLNGALWGQCDSLYTALVLLALADGLEGHPARSVVLLGVAFSFKLQAVFLLPLWCVLWYSRRVKFRHLCLFPIAYLATALPALLLGKPLADILGVYLSQTGQYSAYLTLNAPSLYALIPYGTQVDVALWSRVGILAAFALVAGLLLWLFFYRRRLTDGHILTAALALAIGVPLLLPHMHERYFMLAETLAVIWCVGAPRRVPVAAAVQLAALGGYAAYLLLRYVFPMAWGALLLAAALLFVLILLGLSLGRGGKKPVSTPPSLGDLS